MGLIITTNLTLSTGATKANVWAWAKFHTGELSTTGKVQADLYFYNSEADYNSGLDAVYPFVNSKKVSSSQIEFTVGEIVKAGANCTIENVTGYFYTKLAAKLTADYAWAITVQ